MAGRIRGYLARAGRRLLGSPSAPRVKVEPTPIILSSPLPFANSATTSTSSLPRFVPPVPYAVFLPSPEPVGDTHVTNGANLFPAFAPSSPEPLPQVTPDLLKYLPPKERRAEIVRCFEETMVLHPSFHVGHWAKRVEAMFTWSEGGPASASPVQANVSTSESMRKLAHDVFFGPPPGKKAKTAQPKPTLNFFASACAGLALGALVAAKGNPEAPGMSPSSHSGSRPGTSSGRDEPSEAERCNPAALFALSEQTLGLAERTAAYDVDSVGAMILQLLYLLHCCPGGTSVQQGVFPLVGKMINVARMMGLANDPDEFPGTYSLFDAEARRRVWWDVFYYDLFVSDCMGHPPLIPDNSFTTRLPADVDEDAFGPSSTILPGVSETGDGADKGSAYFVLKCR
ncbi:uncharacterized protein B0H18DRAFT_877465 [Fomitopsis serialis]|uniref:uncharacterized protein n=1 Tax=Fomitopsis serialis TaxID=139415 RepID=UPI002008280B|nr:uncharacterized protein B0H18DRAFT_877465 [Neoantrodia serialis]KAH9925108.1 hypothetical protein B0H18DRAFT_877465 [Neoantrodia serialis]